MRLEQSNGAWLAPIAVAERPDRPRGECMSILDNGWLSLRHTNATDVVRVDRVISVHSAGNNALIVTDMDRYTVQATLRSAISMLEPFGLIRIHRNAAINIARVRRLESRGQHRLRVILDTGVAVDVGRTFHGEVRARFGARTHRRPRS